MPTRLVYLFGDFRLDPTERVLFRCDRPVPLTPKAVETLLALVERHGRLVTKEELLRIVWPDAFVEENNLAQHISVLRRALGDSDGAAPYIETVPKRGIDSPAGWSGRWRGWRPSGGGRLADVDAGARHRSPPR